MQVSGKTAKPEYRLIKLTLCVYLCIAYEQLQIVVNPMGWKKNVEKNLQIPFVQKTQQQQSVKNNYNIFIKFKLPIFKYTIGSG